jgi:DNA-binding LacI/PurR family transcriptional regulator
MRPLRLRSVSEQVADYLREEIFGGGLVGEMPGVKVLAAELGTNHKTVEAALRLLEREGLLLAQGAGRRRRIDLGGARKEGRGVRLGILLGEEADLRLDYIVQLRHELAEAGHRVFLLPKTMIELGMDLGRIGRMVEQEKADAWVVVAGPREVLEWFAALDVPVFALFGRRRGFPIAAAGPDKRPAMVAVARELVGLGHRRIVLLVRPRRRLPVPGAVEQAFLDELSAQGLAVGEYHLPGWGESVEGFQDCLESLFRVTPPTALVVDEVPQFIGALDFCASHGIRVPGQVSLVCTDASPDFEWCRPSVAHIRWDIGPTLRRVVRWAARVSRGRRDVRQTLTVAEFVMGGTVGAVCRGGGGLRPPR